ncbi:undecaprenyl-diphosphate phosphatase [bacterium]|nr:undecaprenyl-diphosphate phosphatase [bacterium]
MSLIEAIILGIIQGLTEFLPVSSSGHIELGKALFDINAEENAGLLFTIVLHFATALSTIVVFRKDISEIFKGLLQFKWNEEFQFSIKIILSMIPSVLVGLLLEEEIEQFFDGKILFVCVMLLLTGIVLFISDKVKGEGGQVDYKKSVGLGIVQAIAILPGISRSGSTIAAALLMNVSRERAARFSFLMVLPLILGVTAKKMLDLGDEGGTTGMEIDWLILGVGFLAAFISGWFACKWMLKIVKKAKLTYFAIYCWLVGTIGIVLSLV